MCCEGVGCVVEFVENFDCVDLGEYLFELEDEDCDFFVECGWGGGLFVGVGEYGCGVFVVCDFL